MTQQPDTTEKIVRRKLSDEVFDRLFTMIEGGEIGPDDKLPSERELMARFGVGRPAIREAMQALETMGLIAISHGERARVTQPNTFSVIAQIDHAARRLLATSPRSLDHLKEAREFFEVGMAREAALHATATDIARLSRGLRATTAHNSRRRSRRIRCGGHGVPHRDCGCHRQSHFRGGKSRDAAMAEPLPFGRAALERERVAHDHRARGDPGGDCRPRCRPRDRSNARPSSTDAIAIQAAPTDTEIGLIFRPSAALTTHARSLCR